MKAASGAAPRGAFPGVYNTISVGHYLEEGVAIVSGKTDVVKGRIKEAAGALTGNDRLREEGKADQAVGKTKQAAQRVVDKVKEAVDKVIE
jgi:uncharacterized protein YjbJ (UPF0337 family)